MINDLLCKGTGPKTKWVINVAEHNINNNNNNNL